MRCDSGKPAYLRLRRVCLTAAPSSAPTHAHPSRFVMQFHAHTKRWALTYPDPVQMNLDGGLPLFPVSAAPACRCQKIASCTAESFSRQTVRRASRRDVATEG